MSEQERHLAEIIIALVKIAGGAIVISAEDLERQPNEVVYIKTNSFGGINLHLKDVTVLDA